MLKGIILLLLVFIIALSILRIDKIIFKMLLVLGVLAFIGILTYL